MVQLSLDFLRSCISVTAPLVVVSLVALCSVAAASVTIPVVVLGAHVEAAMQAGEYET